MKKIVFVPEDFSVVTTSPPGDRQIFQDIASAVGFERMLNQIIFWLLLLAGTLAFIALLYGSLKYLLAAGDTSKAEEAKKTISYSIIGVILIICLLVILKFFAETAFKK